MTEGGLPTSVVLKIYCSDDNILRVRLPSVEFQATVEAFQKAAGAGASPLVVRAGREEPLTPESWRAAVAAAAGSAAGAGGAAVVRLRAERPLPGGAPAPSGAGSAPAPGERVANEGAEGPPVPAAPAVQSDAEAALLPPMASAPPLEPSAPPPPQEEAPSADAPGAAAEHARGWGGLPALAAGVYAWHQTVQSGARAYEQAVREQVQQARNSVRAQEQALREQVERTVREQVTAALSSAHGAPAQEESVPTDAGHVWMSEVQFRGQRRRLAHCTIMGPTTITDAEIFMEGGSILGPVSLKGRSRLVLAGTTIMGPVTYSPNSAFERGSGIVMGPVSQSMW